MTAFGLCALVLAAVGVYDLISYSVQQRRREIGIRVALGAAPGEVWRLVVRQAMTLAAAGILIGVAGALYLVQIITSLLFGVRPRDPVIFAAVPLLFAVVAFIAACVPAGRATRISPVNALRRE